ncbi:MAG: hypothetical protein KDA33_10705, partial [Phycisphaerales bacterium]|nr:hypothetical protein [Phycisphaerales bacterium]
MRGASLTLGAADIGKADTSTQQVHVFDSSAEASASVAHAIVELIRERSREGRRAVLGLATG